MALFRGRVRRWREDKPGGNAAWELYVELITRIGAHRGGGFALPARARRSAGYPIRREPQATDAMPRFTAPDGAG